MFTAGQDAVRADEQIVRWLCRGDMRAFDGATERLNMTLELLALEPVEEGLAALRFWGQTGERSAAWMAAADPVHLEPMINDLRVSAFSTDELKASELRSLYADLQASLAGNSDVAFASIGRYGYLRGTSDFPVANVAPRCAHGESAEKHGPSSDPDGAYHRLLGEIQLALHQHPLNERREANGQRSINSLWFWGGGVAPEKEIKSIPPLFANDELFLGYWESCTAVTEHWEGDFGRCLDVAVGDFIVVADEADASLVIEHLQELRRMLADRRISRLSVLFGDGLNIQLDRLSKFRFWRRTSPFFDSGASR